MAVSSPELLPTAPQSAKSWIEGSQQAPHSCGQALNIRISGASGGGFAFYDISNPRAPVKVSQTDVSALREPHGFGFSTSYGGHYAVMQAINGIQFWDFANPLAPVAVLALVS